MGIPQGIDFQGVYQFGNHERFLQSGKSGQGAGRGESHVRLGVLKESRQIVSINGFAAWIVLNQRSDQAGYPSTTPKIGLSHHVHQIRDQLDAAAWIVLNQRSDPAAGYFSTTLKTKIGEGCSHHVHQIRDQLDAGVKRGEKLLDVVGQLSESVWVCPQ